MVRARNDMKRAKQMFKDGEIDYEARDKKEQQYKRTKDIFSIEDDGGESLKKKANAPSDISRNKRKQMLSS